MNRKSYLKGLGIGIVVTALIFIVSSQFNKKTMSDDDVIKRAKELGMIESTTLTVNADSKDNVSDEGNKVSDNNNQNNVKDDSSDSNPTISDINEDNVDVKDNNESDDMKVNSNDSDDKEVTIDSSDDSNVNEVTNDLSGDSDNNEVINDSSDDDANDNQDKPTDDSKESNTEEYVIVSVVGGQGSETISSSVQKVGLIEDASDFNSYLCQNGYDKKLRVGNHEIPAGADYETIAKKLCGM